MKICIVGTGKIVAEVLLMLKEELANEIEVTGIYSREKSVEKTQAMLEKTGYQVPIYTDYQRMLQEAESDFVYIANANHVHYQYAMQAMTSGHNVIVEKPIARNRVETEEMFDKALMHGVYCLPAYSLLYMPLLRKIIEVLPQIGQVRMVNCFYAQYSSRYDKYLRGEVEPVFDPQCSGGSLMDLDVYNLCFCIALFGPPRTIRYEKNLGFNHVDTSGFLLLHYPGFTASLGASKDSNGLSYGCIQGEKGYIEIPSSVSILKEFKLHLNNGETQTFHAEEGKHRLNYEFREFYSLIEDRKNCHIILPFVVRVAQEIAIALERMD